MRIKHSLTTILLSTSINLRRGGGSSYEVEEETCSKKRVFLMIWNYKTLHYFEAWVLDLWY